MTYPNFETLQLRIEGPVAHLTINRADVLNALSPIVIRELTDALSAISIDKAVRVVVLAGAGDRAFVAGADIAAMSKMETREALTFARTGQALTMVMEDMPQIIVARVHGYALGGGCELAMACDIVVASKRAKFGQPEVGLGLIPGFGGTQRLVRRVGLAVGMDILTSGRTLSGDEAAALGLVSRAVEADQLDSEVNLVVKGLLRGAPGAIAETKRLARQSYSMTLEAGLNAEAYAFGALFGQDTDEARDGTLAFLEKRKAKYCV